MKNISRRSAQGSTLVEAALVIALISLVAVPSIQMVGQAVACTFSEASQLVSGTGVGNELDKCNQPKAESANEKE